MEIVVNTRLLIKDKLDGIGWFTYETMKRLTRQHPEHHFIFLFDRNPDDSFIFSDNITPIVLSPQARHPFLFWCWFEFSVKRLLRDLKPDLFISTDGFIPLGGNTKKLAVIHDLNFAHYPHDLPRMVRWYYNYFFPKFAMHADRIATVSEFSKQDIASTYGIEKNKIDIVFNGANEDYRPLSEAEKRAVQKKHSRSCDYFLFVGSIHPRKNMARLLQAFDAFRNSYPSEIKLLVVGKRYWWTTEIESAFKNMGHKEEVIFTGRLSQEELFGVMGSALALTYIPYFEGFGIPLLEAMNCDVPVITANNTSLPEVAGDAALYADPFSVPSITHAMLLLVKDQPLREKLIEAGRKRRTNFSWDKTAELLWESVEKTVR